MAYDILFQTKVFPLLSELFDTFVGSIYDGRVYQIVPPPLPTFPLLVYQSQDGGGVNDDKIGSNGWNGLITLRSIDYDESIAWSKLQQAITALTTITHSDYSIRVDIESPRTFPIDSDSNGRIYTAGIICVIYIYPK